MLFKERRTLSPTVVSEVIIGQLWPTIVHLKELNQTPTLDKLKAHMYKKYRMTSNDCEKHVLNAIKDQLLVETKGTDKNGEAIDVYMAPEGERQCDGHDWYCYECHKPGSVAECQRCWRVFHSYCMKEGITQTDSPLVCGVCLDLDRESEGRTGERVLPLPELNQMLSYAYNRLITKNKDLLTSMASEDQNELKIGHLVYKPMDFAQILTKTKSNSYKKLVEFKTDCQDIVHSVILLYGTNSSAATQAVQALSDCSTELNEMRECIDCYRMSNQKQDKNWFSKACNPPHDLVFAKQKGYPYWPAKVITRDEAKGLYDVRFFGTYHERSSIELSSIKPITTSMPQLRISKPSPPLAQALKELKQYQNNMQTSIGANSQATRSPVRSVTDKRPRRRADGSRSRKRSIKLELKDENNIDDQNETTNESLISSPSEVKASPIQRRTSTPKPLVKSPIRTRNRGMKTPFQTKPINRTPERSLRFGNANKSSETNKEGSMSGYFKNTSELVSNIDDNALETSMTTPKKRNSRVMNGLTNELNESQSKRAKKVKPELEGQKLELSPSLARTRPHRQSKPNSRYKSPEMETKLKRKPNVRITVKKEPKEVANPSIGQSNGHWSDGSNSGNAYRSPNTSKGLKGKVTRLTGNAMIGRPFADSALFSALPQNNLQITERPVSTPVGPPKRGRPKGVKNKSTIEKMMRNEALGLSPPVSPRPPKSNRPLEDVFVGSDVCNCSSKFNKMIKKMRDDLEAQHKEEIKNLKRDLEAVKQLNYRLQNENRDLKRESQDFQELSALRLKHSQEVSQIKKKQWCFNCEEEAIYFCCWNTSYCSLECQQQHWHSGHKKTCRRVTKR